MAKPQNKATNSNETWRPVHRNARSDDGNAFLPDPQGDHFARAGDDLAEDLAEKFVASATSGEEKVDFADGAMAAEDSIDEAGGTHIIDTMDENDGVFEKGEDGEEEESAEA